MTDLQKWISLSREKHIGTKSKGPARLLGLGRKRPQRAAKWGDDGKGAKAVLAFFYGKRSGSIQPWLSAK